MSRATGCNRRWPGLMTLALAVSAPMLFATAAAGDRLVTRAGSVIETEGAWKVQGRLVVFALPDGQLASVQVSEVDLDASRAATEKAQATAEKPPAPQAPEKTAVMVLTDADVRRAPPTDGSAEETTGEETTGEETPADEPRGSEPPAGSQRLVVSSWEEESEEDGVVITGELTNQSPDVATEIQLAVLLYDRQGELLETVPATVTSGVLQPGQRARFRADAQGVFDYSALRFEAQSLGLAVGGSAGESPGGES